MSPELDAVLNQLSTGGDHGTQAARQVQSQDGTTRFDPSLTANSGNAARFSDYSARVDSLFGDKPAYQSIKHEKPEHRQILWMSLNGLAPLDIARNTGYTPEHIRTIRKQPWFRDAFTRLSSEFGKDAVTTYLQGEVLPALQRVVTLAENAQTETVKLAANREILDRFLGKATVKIESKVSGTIDSTITDVNQLMEESRRIQEQLRANGLFSHSSS